MAVNGKQYAFQDIRVILLGREIEGLRGIKYKIERSKEALHGRGRKTLSIQAGEETVTGELTLLQSELTAMVEAVKASNPSLKITDVAFDIVVTYGEGTEATTDTIVSAEFTDYEKSLQSGDKYMEITMPFLAVDVLENI